jgi:hypothetical protein
MNCRVGRSLALQTTLGSYEPTAAPLYTSPRCNCVPASLISTQGQSRLIRADSKCQRERRIDPRVRPIDVFVDRVSPCGGRAGVVRSRRPWLRSQAGTLGWRVLRSP